jgi:hypothetical protein
MWSGMFVLNCFVIARFKCILEALIFSGNSDSDQETELGDQNPVSVPGFLAIKYFCTSWEM